MAHPGAVAVCAHNYGLRRISPPRGLLPLRAPYFSAPSLEWCPVRRVCARGLCMGYKPRVTVLYTYAGTTISLLFLLFFLADHGLNIDPLPFQGDFGTGSAPTGAQTSYKGPNVTSAIYRRGSVRLQPCGAGLPTTGTASQQQRPPSSGSRNHVATESGSLVPGLLPVLQQEVTLLSTLWAGALCGRPEQFILWLRCWMGWDVLTTSTWLGPSTPVRATDMESPYAFPNEAFQAKEARTEGNGLGHRPCRAKRAIQRGRLAGCKLAAACCALAPGHGQNISIAPAIAGRWQGRDPCGFEGRLCGVWADATGLSRGADGQDGGSGRQSFDQAAPHYGQAAWGGQTGSLQDPTSSASSSGFMATVCAEDGLCHRGWTRAVRSPDLGVRSAGKCCQRESRFCQKGSSRDQLQGEGGRCGAGRVGGLRRGACTSCGGHWQRRFLPAGYQTVANSTAVGVSEVAGAGRCYTQEEGQDGAPSMSRSCIVLSPRAQPRGTTLGNARLERKPKPSHTYAADFCRTDLHSVRAEDDYKSPYIALLLGCLASEVLALDSIPCSWQSPVLLATQRFTFEFRNGTMFMRTCRARPAACGIFHLTAMGQAPSGAWTVCQKSSHLYSSQLSTIPWLQGGVRRTDWASMMPTTAHLRALYIGMLYKGLRGRL